MNTLALAMWSRCKLITYLGLFTIIFISSSLVPAFAQRDDTPLIARAQQEVRAKLLRERGRRDSKVLFQDAKKYPVSKAQQIVRGAGVFRRDPQASPQDFTYQVVFDVKTRPYTIIYVSYLITISQVVPSDGSELRDQVCKRSINPILPWQLRQALERDNGLLT